MIFPVFLVWVLSIGQSYSLPKYINPCGAIYSSVDPDLHGVRRVFHNVKPYIMEILHVLKASNHKLMEEYRYKKTWIPDDSNIIHTNKGLNSAKQLPDIYSSLQYFSYALDVVQEDAMSSQQSDDCFLVVDSLPIVIAKHQQLMCAIDAAMGQLQLQVPVTNVIELPDDWLNPSDQSCVHKFFRFSEVHTKYSKFLAALFKLAHIPSNH